MDSVRDNEVNEYMTNFTLTSRPSTQTDREIVCSDSTKYEDWWQQTRSKALTLNLGMYIGPDTTSSSDDPMSIDLPTEPTRPILPETPEILTNAFDSTKMEEFKIASDVWRTQNSSYSYRTQEWKEFDSLKREFKAYLDRTIPLNYQIGMNSGDWTINAWM